MGLFKSSVKSLVEHGDVRGLIAKLGQKDWAEASLGLQVLRERAVPALIELLGTPQEGTAIVVLVNIGAPALPALAEVIRSGPDGRLAAASTAIKSIGQKGVGLPGGVVATLEAVKTGGPEVDLGRRTMAAAALGQTDLESLERLVRADEATREVSGQPLVPHAADDLGSGRPISPAPAGGQHQVQETTVEVRSLEVHQGPVQAVAVTPDGLRAVSGSWDTFDTRFRVWDLASGRTLRILGIDGERVWAIVVTPDGLRAVSGSTDETLRVWDLASGETLRSLKGHSDQVFAVAVTPDGLRAVSGSRDKTLRVWDLASGKTLRTLKGHSESVEAVAVTPDGLRAVSGSWDKTLRVWDLKSGKTLQTLKGHADGVQAVAVTPDGLRAVSGSTDKTLRVWDLRSGKTLHTLEGHQGPMKAVAVTPDGLRAVSGSMDKTLRVWDLESGRALRTLEGHGESITAVVVTPDGLRAVSSSHDKTVRVWDLASGETPPIETPTTTTSEATTTKFGVSRSLTEVVDEIMALDGQVNKLAEEGKGNSDSEWGRCDDRLAAIGNELYVEGGEARMRAALELAHQKGLRGRYAERHWTGIGTWMG